MDNQTCITFQLPMFNDKSVMTLQLSLYVIGHNLKFSQTRILESIHFMISNRSLNSLPNDKFLDWSKLKRFTEKKINATEKSKFVLGRVENRVGKGENAGYQHFLLYPLCFQKASFSRSLKVGIVR